MSAWTMTKLIGGLIGAGLLILTLWLVLTGKLGFMKSIEERAARERVQRQYEESQRQQNFRRPFEAVNLP